MAKPPAKPDVPALAEHDAGAVDLLIASQGAARVATGLRCQAQLAAAAVAHGAEQFARDPTGKNLRDSARRTLDLVKVRNEWAALASRIDPAGPALPPLDAAASLGALLAPLGLSGVNAARDGIRELLGALQARLVRLRAGLAKVAGAPPLSPDLAGLPFVFAHALGHGAALLRLERETLATIAAGTAAIDAAHSAQGAMVAAAVESAGGIDAVRAGLRDAMTTAADLAGETGLEAELRELGAKIARLGPESGAQPGSLLARLVGQRDDANARLATLRDAAAATHATEAARILDGAIGGSEAARVELEGWARKVPAAFADGFPDAVSMARFERGHEVRVLVKVSLDAGDLIDRLDKVPGIGGAPKPSGAGYSIYALVDPGHLWRHPDLDRDAPAGGLGVTDTATWEAEKAEQLRLAKAPEPTPEPAAV